MAKNQSKLLSVVISIGVSIFLVSCGSSSSPITVDQADQTTATFAPQESDDCVQSSTVDNSLDLEAKFWQKWCDSSISQRLGELGVVMSAGETWKSFAVTIGVNMCNDIGALIAGGTSKNDAQVQIENKFSGALLGENPDMDRIMLAKGVALSAAMSAVEVLCPENAEVEEELKEGSGGGCSVDAIASYSDCSGVDLAGADLSGRDLNSVNLSGSNLEGANFNGADLTYANLSGANAQGAMFNKVRWWRGNAMDANFIGANFDGAYLDETTFVRSDFSNANLVGASFGASDLRRSYLRGVVGFSNNGGKIRKVSFLNAHLGSADLTGAIMPGVNFRGALLTEAILDSADLREAYFECTDLTRVVAIGAKTAGATFNGSTTGRLLDGMTRAVNSERCDARPTFPAIPG
jgi:uncharacterized protein YjbI with pentapeptide repeats